MDSESEKTLLLTSEIHFLKNDTRALAVKAPADADAADLIKALGIKKPATVLLLIGGAGKLDPSLNDQIEELLEDGLAPAATDTEALIIDGGTEAGVMELMGSVIARHGRVTQLLGVAPDGKVTYPGGPEAGTITEGAALDPNHSHFVLVEGTEWSSGTEMMFKLVNELAAESRIVAVLVNGGPETTQEVLRCVKSGWPVVVIKGSGRLADEIAAHLNLTSEGNLSVFPLADSPTGLRRLIVSQAENALIEAWGRFAQYDSKAGLHQTKYRRLLSSTLVLGVVGTLLALSHTQLMGQLNSSPRAIAILTAVVLAVPIILVFVFTVFERFRPKKNWPILLWLGALGVFGFFLTLLFRVGSQRFLAYVIAFLGYLILAIPIVVSVMLTATNYFKPRQKWILLRGSAEAIKREIFRYRTRVGEYSDPTNSTTTPPVATATSPVAAPKTRDEALAENIATISRRLMQTEVSSESLPRTGYHLPKGAVAENDDGYSFLTLERYINLRLENQLDFYDSKTKKLQRQLTELQWSIFIIGGVGTFLAAVGYQLWIAATTALVTALSAYVGHFELEHTMTKYNQSAADLNSVRDWWIALPPEAKSANKNLLVERSEGILEVELTGWVRQMKNTMADERTASGEDKMK